MTTSPAAKTQAGWRIEQFESSSAGVKEGISTANLAKYANSKASHNRIRGVRVVRVFGVFRGYTCNLISEYFRVFPLNSAYFRVSGGLCRTLNRSILGSTESHPTVSKPRGRGGEGVEISRNMGQASVRLFRGQSLLQYKLEKNGISPKTWYWPIFRSAKFEPAASQNYPAEIKRDRALKFLQFLENFSGVYPPGGEGASAPSAECRIIVMKIARLKTWPASVASRCAQSRSVTVTLGSATAPVAVRCVSRHTLGQRCVWRDAKHGARDARAPHLEKKLRFALCRPFFKPITGNYR